MKIAGNPRKIARDVLVPHDGVDPGDRRQARVPHGLRVVAAEPVDELAEPRVGHHRQVRACVAGVSLNGIVPVEDGDGSAGLRQQVRRRQPRDPGADDHDVHVLVAFEPGKARQ